MAVEQPINWDVIPGGKKRGIREAIKRLHSTSTSDEEREIASSLLSDFNTVAPDNISTLAKDWAISGKVAAESAVRELPRLTDAAINTAQYLTRRPDFENKKLFGKPSLIPTSNLEQQTKRIIPQLATDEEMQNRLLPKIVGGAAPYLAAGALAPQAAVARIPSAVKAIAPLIPATGLRTNLAQGLVAGGTEAVSRALKSGQDPSLKDIVTEGGASGALTAAATLLGKGVGAGVQKIQTKGVVDKLKKLQSAQTTKIKPNAFTRQPGQPIAGATALKGAVQENVELPPKEIPGYGLVPEEYLSSSKQVQTLPSGKVVKSIVLPKQQPSIQELTGQKPSPVEPSVQEPTYRTANPQRAEIDTTSKSYPKSSNIAQSRINHQANTLLDTPYEGGQTYREIFDSPDYAPEAKKQIFKTFMTKAEGQAINERSTVLKDLGYDALDKDSQRIVKKSLDEVDDLEHAQQRLANQNLPESQLYKKRIEELQNDIQGVKTQKSQYAPAAKTKQVYTEMQKGALNKPIDYSDVVVQQKTNSIKDNAYKKTNPFGQGAKVNKKTVLQKVGIKARRFLKEEEGSLHSGKILQAVKDTAEKMKVLSQPRNWKQPLRTLQEKGYDLLEQSLRMLEERAKRFTFTVEQPYLRALAEIEIDPARYGAIAEVLDNVDSIDIRNGTVGDLSWQQLSDNEKAWAQTLADFFHESANLLGLPPEKRLGSYITHIKDFEKDLSRMVTPGRTAQDPGFLQWRSADSELGSVNLPEIVLRYANGVRRKLLTESIGQTTKDLETGQNVDPAFKEALNNAMASGDKQLEGALRQIHDNLTQTFTPGEFDNLLTAGIRNYVEASIRNNASSGLLNITQTPTLLAGDVGYPTYLKAVQLLADATTGKNPLLKQFLDTIDFQSTSTARYDLQHSVFQNADASKATEALARYKESSDPKILIDLFGSGEAYWNQPLAYIAGFLQHAEGEAGLNRALQDISSAMQEGRGMEVNNVLDSLRAAGAKVNERNNFIRTQTNRPAYESAKNLQMFLPLINYPIKEAGWMMDKAYELAKNPQGSQGRLAALGAITNYLTMKGLIGGPKTVATLFVPYAAAETMRRMAPEEYAQLEDVITAVDDKGNLIKKFTGRDLSDTIGNIDWSKPWDLQSPILSGLKRAGSGIKQAFSEDATIPERISGVIDAAKFLPTPEINIGGAKIPLGLGQIKEIGQAAVNTARGVRKIGKSEFPTSGGEEAARLLAPATEDVAAYKSGATREEAKTLQRRGVLPSRTQIRELTRGLYGDENAENDNLQRKVAKSISTGNLDKFKTLYYNASGDKEKQAAVEDMAEIAGFKASQLSNYATKHASNLKKRGAARIKGVELR